MQRVTNCIIIENDHVLLLKKPSRGWYAIPGGKMEQGETIKESVIRECHEETELTIINPTLAGVFTFTIFEKNKLIQEWMMFTFTCDAYKGEMAKESVEGELEWVKLKDTATIPMAEGDRKIFEHIRSSEAVLYGSFSYTNDYELLNVRLDPTN